MVGGRWFFVKNLEKEELNMKHSWCGIGWIVFEGSPLIFALWNFFGVKAYFFPVFEKTAAYFFPPTQGRRGAFLARIFTDVYMSKFTAELAFCISTSPLYSKFYQFQSKLVKNCGLMVINLQWVNTSKLWCQGI